jgi:hypothetical protein
MRRMSERGISENESEWGLAARTAASPLKRNS